MMYCIAQGTILQYLAITYNGKESEKEYMSVYIYIYVCVYIYVYY